MIWSVIAVLAAGTLALKALGPVLAGGRPLPRALTGVIALLAPALLAALVVAGTFADGARLVVDARAAAVAVAAVALLARAPLVVALFAAAATAALLRMAF